MHFINEAIADPPELAAEGTSVQTALVRNPTFPHDLCCGGVESYGLPLTLTELGTLQRHVVQQAMAAVAVGWPQAGVGRPHVKDGRGRLPCCLANGA